MTTPAQPPNQTPADGPPAISPQREEFLWHVWFQQMQQLAWLAAAGAGTALIFLEKVADGKPRRRALVAFICFGVSAVCSVLAQSQVSGAMWENKDPTRARKILPALSLVLLGAGAAGLFLLVTQ